MVLVKLYRKSLLILERIINKILCAMYRVELKHTCKIKGIICFEGSANVVIGENVRINSGKKYNVIGGSERTVFRTFDNGMIEILSGAGISNSTFVSQESITIGRNVLIGGGCKFYDTDFHPLSAEERIHTTNPGKVSPIVVKDGAFIGAQSIVLKGVTIGENSIIGAGSVVTKRIPDNEVWAGNPAKFIRRLEMENTNDTI